MNMLHGGETFYFDRHESQDHSQYGRGPRFWVSDYLIVCMFVHLASRGPFSYPARRSARIAHLAIPFGARADPRSPQWSDLDIAEGLLYPSGVIYFLSPSNPHLSAMLANTCLIHLPSSLPSPKSLKLVRSGKSSKYGPPPPCLSNIS